MANIISEIAGGGILKGVEGVVDAVGNQVNKKATLKAAADSEELQADTNIALAQNNVNAVQAASSDKFTSRMRPCAGYGCMAIIAYQGIVERLGIAIAKGFGILVVLPPVDTYTAGTILIMLCGCRSFDKKAGTASSWVDPDK